jgi:hypothetical protein
MPLTMKKILFVLLSCFLFSSCQKTTDGSPSSDYRFEVSCGNCTIRLESRNTVQTYNVRGFQVIPYNYDPPSIFVSVYTNYDQDRTQIRFLGSGYNRTLFNDYLYYSDPSTFFEVSL